MPDTCMAVGAVVRRQLIPGGADQSPADDLTRCSAWLRFSASTTLLGSWQSFLRCPVWPQLQQHGLENIQPMSSSEHDLHGQPHCSH
ncbi:hypothetical protein E2C01_026574 [Portunus trituberculatus]|uniref:Uncharacterized protein n=1 Tax=Portunus trituberculatus TaxID=210409 RepID=A0A5B7EFX8_PORTR|nr:hypothetical protein [Portunus trituberculatus]